MLRITKETTDQQTTVKLEGTLRGEWLEALREACCTDDATALAIDLAGVTFIDTASRTLLLDLIQAGASIAACSGFAAELLHLRNGSLANNIARAATKESQSRSSTNFGKAVPKSLAAEERLIACVRAGNPAAAESFVRLYGGRMLQVARRFMRCDEDAADVVQEAFVSAFRAMDSFSAGSRLSTWLHRITANAALMKLRSRSRRPETSLDGLPTFDAQGGHACPVPEWSRDAFERASTNEVRAQVRQCIDRLPDSYRAVLVLRDIEERDTNEVATLLDCTVANVKTRLHRARQALRGLLEPVFSTECCLG